MYRVEAEKDDQTDGSVMQSDCETDNGLFIFGNIEFVGITIDSGVLLGRSECLLTDSIGCLNVRIFECTNDDFGFIVDLYGLLSLLLRRHREK